MRSPKRKRFVGEGAIVTLTDKGFGFIRRKESKGDLFFHSNELLDTRFEDLRAGDKVHFDIVSVDKSLIAVNIGRNGLGYEIDEVESPEATGDADVRITIEGAAKRLAEIIASRPSALESLEWRDVEQVVAVVFAGLGFQVELTPPSKDGGKDIILSLNVSKGPLSFLIEIKHWRTKVGPAEVRKFLHVIARTEAVGGLMLATSGFSSAAVESLTEFERSTLRFGTRQKIITLCKHYVRAAEGTWYPPQQIHQVILEETI